jgi:hypothetical protein
MAIALAAELVLAGVALAVGRPIKTKTPSTATVSLPAAPEKSTAGVTVAPTQGPTATPAPAAPGTTAATPQATTATPHPTAGNATNADPDESAWQTASSANSREAYAQYLKNFRDGQHAAEAQLAMANVILNGPATGKNFDGTWDTTWTCPNLGQYPGYSYQFSGQVVNGVYHGIRGTKGQPSSLVLDGKIEADGAAAFSGEIIVGSSLVGLGAARGTPSDFHALATFANTSAKGRRIEGRPCILTFQRK